MKKTLAKKLPLSAEMNLKTVGEQIKLARLRRKISLARMAERAGCSELTLIRIEKGNPAVSFGIYIRVLYGLGLDGDILAIARDDKVGRNLQDIYLKNKGKTINDEYDFD
ncbi:MAG: helix-turn-helix domain-containing protein [Bacteroidales bacterium]|nr:helix-turn-helix domain-containing protein [Bacteroidales bacterium]